MVVLFGIYKKHCKLIILADNFNFFKEAVKNYKTSGTIIPSSKHLAKKMLEGIDFSTSDVIVELGPGNGAITSHILKKLHPKATLVCFEINEVFYDELQKIQNPQLVLLKESAENIANELDKLGFTSANHIISSLPLTIIPKEISENILEASCKTLKCNGLFMQYQYSLTYYNKLKTVFGKGVSLQFEPLNFPPAFVYKCKKLT